MIGPRRLGVQHAPVPEAGGRGKHIEGAVLDKNILTVIVWFVTHQRGKKVSETWGCGLSSFDCTDEIIQKLY